MSSWERLGLKTTTSDINQAVWAGPSQAIGDGPTRALAWLSVAESQSPEFSHVQSQLLLIFHPIFLFLLATYIIDYIS
jgi:hypothetical protein